MEMSASFEFQKKLTKIQEELHKREVDVRDRLADIERKKVETLKKVEEMKHNTLLDIEKIDEGILKAKFDAETNARLASEIVTLKQNMEKKYTELRSTILDKI